MISLKSLKPCWHWFQTGLSCGDTRIKPGMKWQQEIEQALARASVALLLVSKPFLASDFISKHELPPLLDAAEADGLTVFWVLLSDCLYKQTNIKKYHAAHYLTKPLRKLKTATRDTVWTEICGKLLEIIPPKPLGADIGNGSGTSPPPDPNNPYRALLAFAEKDEPFFFGRTKFTEKVLAAVEEHPLLAVIGPSGSGKSSVVQAGLVPALRQRGDWAIGILKPGFEPLRSRLPAGIAARQAEGGG